MTATETSPGADLTPRDWPLRFCPCGAALVIDQGELSLAHTLECEGGVGALTTREEVIPRG